MKKIFFILVSALLFTITFAQSVPQGINYQAVARDSSGVELTNQALSIQLSIISDTTTLAISWQETHSVNTNDFGLFSVVIGQGTSTGVGSSLTFDSVNWGSSNHYIKTVVNGIDMGINKLMSVPYALYSANPGPQGPQGPQGPAGPLVAGSTGQTLQHNGTNWVANSNIYNNGISVGVGTNNPNGYILEIEDVDINASKSVYGVGAVTDVDAHFDLNSNSNASWGSSFNLFEFDENTQAFVDGWNIARQTTNGTGNSSLNFNYGIAHNNNSSSSQVTFTKGGRVGIGTTNPAAELEVYGNGDNLVVKINFTGNLKGDFFMTGRPKFDSETKSIYIDDLDFDIKSQQMLIKVADVLLKGTFKKQMNKYLKFSLEEQLDDTQFMIEQYLKSQQLDKTVGVDVEIKKAGLDQIIMKDQSMITVLNIDGKLGIKYGK